MNKISLDTKKIADPGALHGLFRRALRLPEGYGNNLDALYDALTSAGETELIVFACREEPPFLSRAVRVMRDAARENPRLRLIIREEKEIMDVEKIVSRMTLSEKCALLNGADAWHTKAIARLSVPAIAVSDGPHGLRKVVSGENGEETQTLPAVCFPTAAALACSFDRELLKTVGNALGETCLKERVDVLLGPAANIKRSPLCGRNFEYFSEDPYLSGEMAAAHIRGVQEKGVGTSLKHFAANNQETRRMSVSVKADERTLREIYLASFEGAVKGGRPDTVMCSYNKIGGVYSSENERLLTKILRDEWGFDGFTMTDWGAANDRVKGVLAGLELEMPGSGPYNDQKLEEAARDGRLSEAALDRAVLRILRFVQKAQAEKNPDEDFEIGVLNHLARRIARETMVLLKNEGGLLPIRSGKKVAFIGEFAEKPRYQGGGSSHIVATEVLSAVEAARSVSPVVYAPGFSLDTDREDARLAEEAVRVSAEADIAVLFLGLPDEYESEGYDRKHLRLPDNQTALLQKILTAQKNVVVVLHNGAPVEMPWIASVPAVLEAYLGGQMVGGAAVDVLFGAVSPSGKLAETFPKKLSDTPCFLNFPGEGDQVAYREGVYVGYRYYDKKEMDVLFPFGHGLSYTAFEYRNLRVSRDTLSPDDSVTVTLDVKNTGSVAGKEIVQIYVRSLHDGAPRPVRELRGFEKVGLAPGETKAVSVVLAPRAFAYWEEKIGDWYGENGAYAIEAAASSRDIRLTQTVNIQGAKPLPIRVTRDTTLGDLLRHPRTRDFARDLIQSAGLHSEMAGSLDACGGDAMADAMLEFMPLHAIFSFDGGRVDRDALDRWIARCNREACGSEAERE